MCVAAVVEKRKVSGVSCCTPTNLISTFKGNEVVLATQNNWRIIHRKPQRLLGPYISTVNCGLRAYATRRKY